ncbi:uncharacterized protein MAM_01880 [Metarhizium album ARSEF 1941]|uniref:Uncharacterized protein n=1 Tax=Metarhizium album (strain ARSEF 1941) TaxID=1081103 RepID=A0A0B2WV22_METAS|nr:uncharacterized protein MAM_01880 [Metarhizium album ARSEF 1941]KHN99956.1 hypothetical protein MAM_01880 [Metarhizium album ARSEF 1941]
MFPTKPARALRNLFAGYHEPAGLSKQQTQKLLDGLKASFRRHLDREYGRIGFERAAVVAKVTDPDDAVRHSAATRHLRSILSNPLFSYSQRAGSPSQAEKLHATRRDPMDVFDHAVAKGMMTLTAATGCMVAKRQLLSASDAPQDLSSSQTALRVVRWLRSSGAESKLSFLHNLSFVRALTPLLVAEGLESIAWEWITRAVGDASLCWETGARVNHAAFLLAQIVRTKSQPQHGNLDAAITAILDAERLYRSSPLLPQILVLPWRSVSWLSTVESYTRDAPSERLFDAHLAAAELLPTPVEIEKAHLHLHHPTHPDHAPALRLFGDRKKVRKLVARLNPDRIQWSSIRGMGTLPWLAFLGHDTVNHLTRSGRKREADSLTELLRSALAIVPQDSLSPT